MTRTVAIVAQGAIGAAVAARARAAGMTPVDDAALADADLFLAAHGVRFVDAGIIGGPPRPGEPGPTFYA